jgi:hypothetical protein
MEPKSYVVALWSEGSGGAWQLTQRGADEATQWTRDLPVAPRPDRLPEAKAAAEEIVGPCVWVDRDPVVVGPWRVVSAVGMPSLGPT